MFGWTDQGAGRRLRFTVFWFRRSSPGGATEWRRDRVNRPRDALRDPSVFRTHVLTLTLYASSATFQGRQDPHIPWGRAWRPWGYSTCIHGMLLGHSWGAWVLGVPHLTGWHTRDGWHSTHSIYTHWFLQWVPVFPQGNGAMPLYLCLASPPSGRGPYASPFSHYLEALELQYLTSLRCTSVETL